MQQTYFRLFYRIAFPIIFFSFISFHSSRAQVLYSNEDSTNASVDSAAWFKNFQLHSRDTVGYFPNNELYLTQNGAISVVNMNRLRQVPYGDINQMLRSGATGVHVLTPSAEPGKRNGVFIRGYSDLILNNGDVMEAQPTYVINGIPVILDHPFAYQIQRFDIDRLGTENNLLSFIDVNDIKSIEVLKDFSAAAKYGPLSANGVVKIETYGPRSGELRVDVNAHVSYGLAPEVVPVNGRYVRDFRQPFYDKYASTVQLQNYPAYLADSTRPEYFGPADWDELYFQNSASEGVQAAISGGSRLANFRFSVGHALFQGVRDATGFKRYNVNFGINIMPVHNLLITTYLSGATMKRDRNRFIRSRIGDEDYVLNLESPPSPNKSLMKRYYFYLEQQLDRNKNNEINALANAQYTFSKHFKVNSRLGIDYQQNFRDLFIPSTVSDGNNFVSNFDGFNRRIVWDNALNFNKSFGKVHHLTAAVGMYTQWDKWSYKYGKAYKGKSDYIKIYQPGTEEHRESTSNNFRLTANFVDVLQSNLASFYGNIRYDFKHKYAVGIYLRKDGSSNIADTKRWLFSPTISAAWTASNEEMLKNSPVISLLKLRGSWGRVGKLLTYDYYKAGPVYNVGIGWNGSPNMATYNAFPVLNASYDLGYITNAIEWPYVQQANVGLDMGLLKNKIRLTLDVYSKEYKNLLLKVPVMEERGYTGVVRNGMAILNKGFEASLSATVVETDKFSWDVTLSAYANTNELTALPAGYKEMIIADRYFKIGQPVNKYWILLNEGIYSAEEQIPVDPETHEKMSYQGIPLKVGDPAWKDLNHDYVIDDEDRVLKGSPTPDVAGFFGNQFQYKHVSLGLLFHYALGREVMNAHKAGYFDFANREGADNLTGVKEINFWQKQQGDYNSVPTYNPWSAVNPYQVNQSLFLEDASFVKLRSVSLAYDFRTRWLQTAGIRQLRIYASAKNVWTWTEYDAGDPEAVSYFGYDNGYYNWSYPTSFTLGFNFKF